MAEGIVIVFDFDRTLIDGDSDNWVVTEMGLTEIFHQLRFTLPWNRLMDRMMTELHSQGRSVQDIEACLQRIMPIDSHIVEAIKSAKSLGCDLKIVSDANQFFIEKILEQHDLLDCFSDIYTNPTSVDEIGKLRISPYHGGGAAASTPPHSCNLCPPNLCKGLVMDHIRASSSSPKDQILTRFIYLGDGGGDFCPTLKLRECDCVMPRTNYPLWKRISDNPSLIKADVKEWSSAEELQRILMQLILMKMREILKSLYTSECPSAVIGEVSWLLTSGAVVGDELPGGYTVIGGNNIIGHHAVVGVKCQDLKYKQEPQSSTSSVILALSLSLAVVLWFQDVPKYMMVTGERGELRGLNLEGLRRNGFTMSKEHNQDLCSVPTVGAMLQSIRDSFTDGRRGICKFRQWLDS
uniref:UDP N-acetylglucosamine O-acyltransferase C-terminal domain-containing protein n=1 Tax=Brassica oleracea var. oleracea TaxID=109376 RepID=A0A0D3A3F7_BRAOL